MATSDDFYEPDEPVDKIISAFESGEKGVTGHPTWSGTSYLTVARPIEQKFDSLANKSTRELVSR